VIQNVKPEQQDKLEQQQDVGGLRAAYGVFTVTLYLMGVVLGAICSLNIFFAAQVTGSSNKPHHPTRQLDQFTADRTTAATAERAKASCCNPQRKKIHIKAYHLAFRFTEGSWKIESELSSSRAASAVLATELSLPNAAADVTSFLTAMSSAIL
jgi:hypothetical protein